MKRLGVGTLVLVLLVGACGDGGEADSGTDTYSGVVPVERDRSRGTLGDGPEETYQAMKQAHIDDDLIALRALSTDALKQSVKQKFDAKVAEVEAHEKEMRAKNPTIADTMKIKDPQVFHDNMFRAEIKESVVYVEGLRGSGMAETEVDGAKAAIGLGSVSRQAKVRFVKIAGKWFFDGLR